MSSQPRPKEKQLETRSKQGGETTHEFLVRRVPLLRVRDGLKSWQGGPVLFGKLLSGEELSKEFFYGHRPNEIVSHLVVHIVVLAGSLSMVENLPALLQVCELWICDTVGTR